MVKHGTTLLTNRAIHFRSRNSERPKQKYPSPLFSPSPMMKRYFAELKKAISMLIQLYSLSTFTEWRSIDRERGSTGSNRTCIICGRLRTPHVFPFPLLRKKFQSAPLFFILNLPQLASSSRTLSLPQLALTSLTRNLPQLLTLLFSSLLSPLSSTSTRLNLPHV